jgi:iron complex outermembrane receptor protein
MSEVENPSQPKYTHIRRKNLALRSGTSLAILSLASMAHAQQTNEPTQLLPEITVTAPATPAAYGTKAQYNTSSANLGPLGEQSILNTPTSVTVVPEDLIVNQQAQTVNDTLRYLPSVEIRDQQGFEVSRPQSRGFQGSIVQNTRLDGLNIVGTTAIAADNLSTVQVLNGLAGSLYGPETPAGVFNYVLKRPTDEPLERFIEGYDASGVWTEQMDLGGRTGNDGNIGYRINAVHGEGASYVSGSNVNRTLLSADLDFHIDSQTVVETDFSHYETNITGLPGSIVYDTNKGSNTSTVLPAAVDPSRVGYGQPGAGADLVTNTGLVKLKHKFNDQWSLEAGVLYQDSVRNLFGISNIMTDNAGNYTVTKNFAAVPHFTIASNTLSLNGHVDLFGLKNDVTIATNGFTNYQYSYRNNIVLSNPSVLNLADPAVLSFPATPNNGGQYESAAITEQSIITGDTIHFNDKLALQGVLNTSFLNSKSFGTAGQLTSTNKLNGVVSPTVSLIYKPVPTLTTYATAASSVEQGEQAPTGTINANQFMAPYHDRQYEVGAKYAASDDLLVTLAAFSMTRPLANTNAANIFSVVGTQRNNGLELFAQGNALPDLSVFGGVTYIDARLNGTGSVTTNDMLVVGVPRVKTDIALDYHPTFAEGFAVTGAAHYESDRAATDTNNSFAPSYATFDAGVRYSAGYKSHRWTARLQVLNATNKFYYSSIADGNIVGSPGANTAYLGAPRTLMASLEIDY